MPKRETWLTALQEDTDKIGEVSHQMSQQFISCVLQIVAFTGYILLLELAAVAHRHCGLCRYWR